MVYVLLLRHGREHPQLMLTGCIIEGETHHSIKPALVRCDFIHWYLVGLEYKRVDDEATVCSLFAHFGASLSATEEAAWVCGKKCSSDLMRM